MAGLLRRKKKEEEQQEPVPYDYSFDDTMESITADLPGQEPEPEAPEQPEEDAFSDTPDEALRKFWAQRRAESAQDRQDAAP